MSPIGSVGRSVRGRRLPDAIPDSVVAHWAADDLSSGFSEWVDRESGFVFNNNGATYVEEGVNGNPSIDLDGVDDYLLNTSVDLESGTTEKTVCIVYEPLTVEQAYLLYQADTNQFGGQAFSMFLTDDTDEFQTVLGGSRNQLGNGGASEPHISSATFSKPDASGAVGANGDEINVDVGGETGEDQGLFLGGRSDFSGGSAVNIHALVGDIIVAEGRSIDDYRQINDFLSDKYGMAIS